MKSQSMLFYFILFITSFAIAWKGESTLAAVFSYVFFVVLLTGVVKNWITEATKQEQKEDNTII